MAIPLAALAVATGAASTETATEELATDGSVTARCPAGKVAVLAGMRAQFDADEYSYVEALTRPSRRAVRFEVYVPTTLPTDVTAIATCKKKPKSSKEQKSVAVPPDSRGSVSARCPRGSRIAFGGFRGDLTGSEQYLSPLSARATSDRRWKVTGTNTANDAAGTLTSIAYCGDVPETTERSDTAVVGPFDNAYPPATATARCKRDERLVYGGFAVNAPGVEEDEEVVPIGLERRSSRKWSVTAVNDGAEGTVKAYAYCAER